MPYSDNLYSALDEEAEIEAITDPLGQPGPSGLGVAPTSSRQDPYVVYANTRASQEALNLGDHVDVEDTDLFSPTDGYFGSISGTSSNALGAAASSNVSYVPDLLVEDPSLERSTAEGKAREAEQERLGNIHGVSDYGNEGRTAAFRNDSASAYSLTTAQQSTGAASQSRGATYYNPSSPPRTILPSTTAPASYTTYSTRRFAYHGEHSPFLPSEAPPAYTPSPTSSSGSQDASRNYSTFSRPTGVSDDLGRLEESSGLSPRQPQSMGSPNSNGSDQVAPARRQRIWRYARNCKMMVLSLVLLLITIGFLTRLVRGVSDEKGSTHKPPPSQPDMNYPDMDGGFSWDSKYTCKNDRIARPTKSFDVSFDPERPLTLVQKTIDDDGRHGWSEVHVQGVIVFRRTGSDTPDSSVVVETIVNDDNLAVNTFWNAENQLLVVTVPHRIDWSHGSQRPCVNVKITVWIPEGGALDRLEVNTVHLDIKLLDNLSLSVSKHTKLNSIAGSVVSASTGALNRHDGIFGAGAPEEFGFQTQSFRFRSRFIEVKTTASPIKGLWPLYDYLGLESTAGNINVLVQPKEVDKDAPKPAILYIKSMSGNVDFRQPILEAEQMFKHLQMLEADGGVDIAKVEARADMPIPARDYRVDVYTTSGDIVGAAAFSSSAGFRSMSGAMTVDLLPVLDWSLAKDGGREAGLRTISTSGRTEVSVLEPMWVDASSGTYLDVGRPDGWNERPPLRCLYAEHSSTSSNIKLRYPGSWEGDIALSSLTGELKVAGDGVKLIKAGSDWPGFNKTLLARKGKKGEGGKIGGKSTSGDVDVVVGEMKGVDEMNWLTVGRG
ncbi:hypothetical protein MFIFM68171_03591 [Madurella fahalii]|uniref:Uncharacterized protein n=1 Tax=Madurella fahalii TaxID=1157608 RepID=A0ABQ0G6K8_9PEZI